jgi:hypothetical protein
MQATMGGDDLDAGAKVEVVGIGKHNLGADLGQPTRRHRFDGAFRADGHEARRLNHTVRRRQTTGASVTVLTLDRKGKSSRHQSTSMASPKL